MGKWTPTIPNYPPARLHRRRPPPPSARESERATPKSLLLLRLVSSFNSDHRPEDLEQTEADEQQRAAREGELREGARLALRPACVITSWSTPSTRRPVRRLDGVEGAPSTPRRRGPPVDCRTDRDWSPSLPKKVDLSSFMGPRGGPRRGTPSCAAASAQSAHSRVARTCAARIGAERLCASSSDRIALPEQPCVLGWRVGGRVRPPEPLSANALLAANWLARLAGLNGLPFATRSRADVT